MKISVSEKIKASAPELQIIRIEADIKNIESPGILTHAIMEEGERIREKYALSEINKRRAISATRAAYKSLGKDPNRYRPSAEALCRRMVQGKGLYAVTVAVDTINLISLHTGHSIGGFDLDKIEGDSLVLGVGEEGEAFEAIGRGSLNIAGLPVYRDSIGGIGTPTSDCERTKLTENTTRLLMLVNMYGTDVPAEEIAEYCVNQLEKYCSAGNIKVEFLRASD